MHRFPRQSQGFVFNVFYNWIQCKNSCPLITLCNKIEQLTACDFYEHFSISSENYGNNSSWFVILYLISSTLLRSVNSSNRHISISDVSSFSSSLALISFHQFSRELLLLLGLLSGCHRAASFVAPNRYLNGFGFGAGFGTRIHIRIYSCVHISCLAAVCGLE